MLNLTVQGNARLLVAQSSTVGEYDATTGELLNANFITGFKEASHLAVSGNTLYVSDSNDGGVGTVGDYDATTGAPINARLISGLSGPEGLAVLGNTLFVALDGTARGVGTYDATTGAALNPTFITI
jgi:hypothetical protein